MKLAPTREPVQVLINFTTLLSSEDRYALEQNGVHLLDYVPENSYTAVIDLSPKTEYLLTLPVYSIINAQPEWKAGAYVWNKVRNKRGPVEVLVSFYGNVDAAKIKEVVAALGGRVNSGPLEQYGNYKIIIAAEKVRSLAQWYGVKYISPVNDIVPLDLQSRPAVKGNIGVAAPMNGGYGLAGDSVTVGVGDNASGIYHADLKDRITNFNPAPMSHHGEHVNGIVGGAAIVDPLAASMAPHVSLLDFFYDLILPATGAMYNDYHMTITNNSYEVIAADCSYAGTYDIYSQLIDTLSVQYPEVLHVFASGNDGWMTCTPFAQGFGTLGGGYQPAKNSVVVGSMTDFQEQAADESRGPTNDGRLKPEIVATGLGAYSTIDEDQYAWAAGTSMAAPQVAGGLAVLTQRYKQLHGGTQPRADLMKAILLDGAMDLGNPGPDFSYGYGVMDIYRSLDIIDHAHYQLGNMATGDSQTVTITVPAGTGHLKVLLCWADVPASATSARQLVNDLDLTVKDPSGVVHLPLVADPTPANVAANATEHADHTNNTEQVTILNPPAGTYTIKIKGYSVPMGPQAYAMAYDVMPQGLHLTFPIGGEQLANSMNEYDSTRVFWDAVSDGNMFTVKLSTNNGGTWTTISDTIAAGLRRCDFIAAGISSGNCLVRLSRNGTSEVVTSQRFVINTPPVVTADTAQCPGYINIHWSPVPNASKYYLLRKVGKYMQVVDSVADTVYSFSGLPLNEKSYVAVQPVIDGLPGYRSLAVIRQANTGNCTMPVSNGDLMAERLASRNSGRKHTSTEFGASSIVKVRLRNLYTTMCSSYTLSYKVNAGAWQTLTDPGPIPANGTADISLIGVPVAPVGVYNITVAVHNTALTDPQPLNDTMQFVITSLPNDTLSLSTPFVDDFETMSVFSITHDSMGVSPNAHWDFFSLDSIGRMRSFVNSSITIGGTRSVSLDEKQNVTDGSKNTFVGTFNLSNYDTATTEIRFDFDYMLHGTPKVPDGNIVSLRAYDTLAWHQLYAYDLSAYPGNLTHVRSLSLTDAMRQAGRNFSSDCQVSFGQNDTSLIATQVYGNGMTFDNVRIYTVTNDVALEQVVSPIPANCGLAGPQPVIVKVHNGVNHTLYNVQMNYSLDGGATFSGVIDSITAKATINYTFAQQVNPGLGVTHTLNAWLNGPGDSYTANDTISGYHFRNSPIITTYPYLENFEAGDGGYYSDGFKNSWQYGTPASAKVNKAASGTKAWKTNLTGHYNNLERSYLYSPCFDLSSMAHPMLSFSAMIDIENCGSTLCDAAYVEVSYDGETWSRLGAAGQGTNWYDSTFNVWNTQGFTRWHVATIPLPQPGPGIPTHLRFVMSADPGFTLDGIGVDDIHIYDRKQPIYPASGITTQVNDVSGNQWTDQLADDELLSAVQPGGQTINGLAVTLYQQDTLSNPGGTQYTFPRSYRIATPATPADTTAIRLYITDEDVAATYNDTTCPSCNKFQDAYSLGITQYDNSNDTVVNGTLADDTGGVFTYYPYNKVQWVPYDKGYYAEVRVKPFSEFWFNDGGPTASFPAGVDYLNFVAYRSGNDVTASWYSLIDTAVDIYTPQWSLDSTNFASLPDTAALHLPVAPYSINDPVNFAGHPAIYYRLKWTMLTDDNVHYSPVRKVSAGDSAVTLIAFDARMISHSDVLLSWVSQPDGVVNHYILERARGTAAYTTIATLPALHRYGQQYSSTDQPGADIPSGILLHYRLTAVMEDGTSIVLPERTVEWVNMSGISIYPNPTHDGNITLNWQADAGSRLHLLVSDIAGRTFYETTLLSAQWNNVTTIQTFNAPKGMYFVRADINGRKYFMKMIYQ